jgi:MinD-like ATPase involved in chromosome partitioning or flagellar assembly
VRALLVTVAGPGGRRDLSLPADAPVAELLPVLARLVGGGPTTDGWALRPAGGRPLPAGASLAAGGVLNGTLLHLARPQPVQPTPPPPPPPPRDGRTPAERTAAALPPRHPLPERATLAARALLASPQAPADVTGVRCAAGRGPEAPLRRARDAWRSSSYLRLLGAAIEQPRLGRPVTVAVAAAQHGAGATTVTALLGTVLAWRRQERVLALDAGGGDHPGSLARTLGSGWEGGGRGAGDLLARLSRAMPGATGAEQVPARPVEDLVAQLARAAPTRLDAPLGQAAHGLAVLPAPARRAPLDARAWQLALERLGRIFPLLLLDCGAGLAQPAGRAAVRACDQLLLVTDADPAAASLAVEAGLPLVRAGVAVTLVVNRMPAGDGGLDLDRLGGYLPDARGLVAVPSAPQAAAELAAGTFTWPGAPARCRRALHELAASLAADWPRPGPQTAAERENQPFR